MSPTFADVVRFLADRASRDDLEKITPAVAERRKALDLARMKATEPGQPVRIDHVASPYEYLNSLVGTVDRVTRGVLTPTAVVLLDAPSARRARDYGHHFPQDAAPQVTVTLACVYPR